MANSVDNQNNQLANEQHLLDTLGSVNGESRVKVGDVEIPIGDVSEGNPKPRTGYSVRVGVAITKNLGNFEFLKQSLEVDEQYDPTEITREQHTANLAQAVEVLMAGMLTQSLQMLNGK